MKDIKTAIEMQLAVADEIKSDFISLTAGEGKRILKLLKEQEPIAPKRPKTVYAYEFACGNCEACVDLDWIVCPWCGRRIKWE